MAKTGLYYVYANIDHTTKVDGDKGDITISSNGDVYTIDTPTVATVATDDKVIIKDTSNSDATRYVTAQSIADLYSIPNGDKGDITTSSAGTVWTIDTPASVTPATDDKILIKDTSDSDNFKRVSVQSIIDLVPSLTDGDKGDITVSSSGTVFTIDTPTMTSAATDDKVLIKDTSAADATRYVTVSSINSAILTLNDGDKGDITVSSSGTVMTIDTPTSVSPATNDKILIKDTSAADATKYALVSDILALSTASQTPWTSNIDSAGYTLDNSSTAAGVKLGGGTNGTHALASYMDIMPQSGAVGGSIRLGEAPANGTNYTGFQAPASLAGDYPYTLPSSYPGFNGYVLACTTTGTLSWTALTTTVSDGDKGDITVSSSGTVWTIDNDVVTYAKMQNVSATDKLLGRSTAGAGDVEEIACTAAGRALIDDADAAAQRTTLGLVIGTNVQAYDPELAALAGLTSAADKLPYFTGSGTAALADLSSAMRTFMTTSSSANLRSVITDETGTGSAVFATSPTLVTPVLGAATATSINFGQSTLNYYETGTWTPTFTCATVGNLSVSYATQSGNYVRIGDTCIISWSLTCTPTFTTASGVMRIDSLPFTIGSPNYSGTFNNVSSGVTWPTNRTMIVPLGVNGQAYINLVGLGSALAQANVNMTQIVSGAAISLNGTLTFLL